ncbi:MAG TPA: hypothetical protein VK753_11225, partial [Xanthomonadaceae bacterium]|nr:hypothetical protein [Xanthomonadaceae bacterium]
MKLRAVCTRILLIAAAGLAANVPAIAASSANLIVDPGAESGKCTSDWKAVTTVPGWTVVQGNPSTVCYSIGSFSTPSSPAAGNAFIA